MTEPAGAERQIPMATNAVAPRHDPILAIDPGTTRSAWVVLQGGRPVRFGIDPNKLILLAMRAGTLPDGTLGRAPAAVIEQVASYGMAVGAEVFETVRWSGRFEEAMYPTPVVQLTRKTIVLHLCNSPRATDSNVRRALMDKFGGDASIGLKKTPGPLYGLHDDLWAALAVAVAYAEGAKNPEPKR